MDAINIAIRQANPDDLPTLVKHNLAMWELDPGEDRPDQLGIHKAFFDAHKHFGAFIAEDRSNPQNPKAIGSVISYQRHPDAPIVDKSKKRGTIALLYVSDKYRRRGIGTALMQHALNHLEKAGCEQVGIYGTSEGMALYKKMGFTRAPEMRLKFNTTQGPLPLKRAKRAVLSRLQSHKNSARITVRNADLENNKDVRILIRHEKGIPSKRNVGAYKKFCKWQKDSQAFIAQKNKSPIGSILVGEWKYPVAAVFTSASRKDLFTKGIRANNRQVAEMLLNRAIKYGKGKKFTQFNIDDHQGHEALLKSHGFEEGIKMELDLHPKTAGLYRRAKSSVTR
jgi:ribosomal protein S18 acetylase RimI-like enzyme